MKKAVIETGGKQYLVAPGDELDVELLAGDKSISFSPLLVLDEKGTQIGKPTVSGVTVKAELISEVKGDKVIAIRYKAKKRVNKRMGHRQKRSRVKITAIS